MEELDIVVSMLFSFIESCIVLYLHLPRREEEERTVGENAPLLGEEEREATGSPTSDVNNLLRFPAFE